MTTAAEQSLRAYAGRCLIDGNPSNLVAEIPASLLARLPQDLRDTYDLFLIDFAKYGNIDGSRILKELANGSADGLAERFATLATAENIPPMETIE